MIRLFNQDETNFQHNKYILNEATKCDVTEYLNDTFEINLEYPINDKKGISQLLTTNAIVKAPVGDDREDQLFVIRQPKQSISKTSRLVSAYGQAIAIDRLSENIVPYASIVSNRKDAIASILNNTLYTHNFTVGNKDTNTTVGAAFKVTRVNPISAIMGNDEATDDNSTIANEFGGDIIFDNFTIDVVDQRGEDNNIIIAYKKNITGVEMQVDDMDIITDIIPVGKDVEGNPLLLPEYHIQSSYFNNYPHPYVSTTDVDIQVVEPETDEDGVVSNADDVMTIEQCYTKMREAAAYMYNSQKVDQLNFTLTVNFVQLENTLEYENYTSLQRVKQVGDYVTIKHGPLGLNLKGRVNKIVWDCLNLNKKTKKPKIKEIEIGFTKKTLSDIISETNKTIKFTEQSILLQVSNLNGSLSSRIEINDKEIREEVTDLDNRTSASLRIAADNITALVQGVGASSSLDLLENRITTTVIEDGVQSTIQQSSDSIQIGWNNISNKVTIDDTEGLILGNEDTGTYSKVGYDGKLELMMAGATKPYHCLMYTDFEELTVVGQDYNIISINLPSMFDGIPDDEIAVSVSVQKVYKDGYYLPYWFGGYGEVIGGVLKLKAMSAWRSYSTASVVDDVSYDSTDGWVTDVDSTYTSVINDIGSPEGGGIILRYTIIA